MVEDTGYTGCITATGNKATIDRWKAIYDAHIGELTPNRKSAAEMLAYIKSKYPTRAENAPAASRVVVLNAMGHRAYLPEGIFDGDAVPAATVLIVEDEGLGKALYDRQSQDYQDWVMEQQASLQDFDAPPYEKSLILIGVETVSGYIHVEGSQSLAAELFAYQGLNEKELTNIYLVARFVTLQQRFSGPDPVNIGL